MTRPTITERAANAAQMVGVVGEHAMGRRDGYTLRVGGLFGFGATFDGLADGADSDARSGDRWLATVLFGVRLDAGYLLGHT